MSLFNSGKIKEAHEVFCKSENGLEKQLAKQFDENIQ
jgi:hypothetical protein